MAKRLNYQIGITADASQFNSTLQKALEQLGQLGQKTSQLSGIREAATAALELQQNLAGAVNQNTGKLDLVAFDSSLKKSGKTLNDYYSQLSRLGNEGTTAFLKVAQSVISAEAPLKRSNKLMNELWITMKNTMRWQITSSALHGFVGQLETAYGYAKDLDSSLNNIRIVTSKTADDMREFAQYANDAAKALSTTTTNYTDASLIYYQQGLDDEQVRGRTDTTIKMANVSNESAETASEQLTAIWNNFYDGSKSLEYYADVMVALGASTASSSDEIAEGIQKFASVADTVGLSYEYAASALATLTANTRESASVVGTALRTLFTRFQGLSLGETLEDGTDLNKYSKALATVGVQIKDASGELKTMDEILVDTADKWGTLTRAEQMALAQTVAGVRQYTQFINLMENWGDFQENLQTAYASTGALEEQANIYAESWEAARNRVRASAEDIYDSLINPDFYIGIDNVISPILSGTADVIDSMGGLQGVLATTFLLINKVYGDKIAQSMRDMANNIGLIKNNDQARAQALREQAAELAKNITLHQQNFDASTVSWAKIVELEGKASAETNNLTESQRVELQNDLEHLRNLQSQVDMWGKIASKAAEAAQDSRDTGYAHISEDDWMNNSDEASQIAAQRLGGQRATMAKDDVTEILVEAKSAGAAFDALVKKLAELTSKSRKLGDIVGQIKALGDSGQASADDIRNLVREFEQFRDLSDVDIDELLENESQGLVEEIGEIGKEADVTREALMGMGDGTNAYTEAVRGAVNSTVQATVATQSQEEAIRNQNDALEEVTNNLEQHKYNVTDWANRIVSAGTALSQLSIAINAIQSLGRVFSDEDMTAGERLTTILTSLTMLLPAISGGLQLYTSMLNVNTAAKVLNITAEEAQTLSKGKLLAANLKNIAVTVKDTTVTIANAAAKLAIQHPAILAVTAAIVAATAVIYLAVEAYHADAEAAKEAAEEAEKAKEAYDDVKSAYDELKSTIADYNNAKEGLDQLVKGTDEWREAVSSLNQQVLELLEIYPQLAQYISSEDGVLNISDAGQKALLDAQEAQVRDAYQTSLFASGRANTTQQTSLETDFKRTIGNYYNSNGVSQSITSRQIDQLREAVNKEGEGVLLNVETLRKSTSFSIELASKIVSNRDAVLELIASTNALIDSNEILANQLGLSILEEEGYTGLKNEDQVAQIVGNRAQDLYDTKYYNKYKDKAFGKTDEEVQKEYAEMMGYQWVDNLSGNKGEYLVNGESKEISDSVARAALAQRDAQEAAAKDIETYVSALDELTGKVSKDDAAVQDAVANLGIGIADFSSLTQDQVNELASIDFSDLSKETQKALGIDSNEFDSMVEEAVSNYNEAIGKVGEGMAYSVQDALKEIDMGDLSLDEMQDVADIFALASAYGVLDEAIDAYNAGTLEEFADGIRSVTESLEDFQSRYADIHKIIDGIATGDTISAEDYGKLSDNSKQYFAMMLDGTYKLTANAAEFYEAVQEELISEATQKVKDINSNTDELRNLQGYDYEGLTKNASYVDDMGNNKFNNVTVQQQIDLIRLLGDQSDETRQKIDAWQQQLNNNQFDNVETLQEIADMVGECGAAYEGLTETIANNEAQARQWDLAIASSYDNLGDLREAYEEGKISLQAFTDAAANLDKITDTEMLDPEEWEDFADYLQDAAGEMEGLNDEMDDNEARTVAKGIMKMNDAIEDLADNFDDWSDIIQNSSEDSEEFADAMKDCRKAVANLLDINEDFVSSDFISENLDLIKQAATGSGEAIDALKSKLADNIIANIILENGLDETATANVMSAYESLKSQMPDIKVGATLDTGSFIDGLNELILQTGMSVDQVNALCDALGFEASYATEPQETTYAVPVYETTTKDNGTRTVTLDDGTEYTAVSTITSTRQIGTETMTGEYATYAMDVSADGSKAVPKITGLTKKATGSYNNYSSRNPGGGSPGSGSGGGGGGGGSSEPKTEEKKESNAEPDRYHRINRVIQEQADLLDEVSTQADRAYGNDKLRLFAQREAEINKQIDNQNTKLKEAEYWLEQDTDALQKFLAEGGNEVAVFDENGEIANYNQLQANELAYYEASLQAYNDYIDKYNAMSAAEQEAAQDEFDAQTEQFDDAEERWSKWQEYISQYEETLDTVHDQQQEIIDQMRELADLKLQEIDYKLEIVLDVKNMQNAVDEFWKTYYENEGDYLSHFRQTEELARKLAESEVNMFDDYMTKWNSLQEMLNDPYADQDAVMEDIMDLQSQMLDSAEAIVEWANTIEEIIPEAVSAAADRFALFTDQLDHNTSVLETIKELYALQGVTNKTASGFNTLQNNMSERLEAQTANAVLQKRWADEAEQRLAQAQAELDAYIAAGGAEDNEYDRLKKARDAYLEEYNDAQEEYLSLAKEAMETAQEMYLEQIERAIYEFGQAVSNGLGLDLLSDKYDHYIEAEERYLDKVNEAYQVASWYNKLQTDIDKATNVSTKERLKALQEEIDMRREGGKLSQYDLDILEAKYEVLQAQMALEDAQNAKNKLELVRDRQGNWNYQYTADPSQIEDAEQNLLDAQNNWYNIAKEQVTEVTGEIISTWQECQEAVEEIYNDMTLTDQERADRAAEIYSYYTEKIKYLEEEKQVAISDMTQAGNESLLTDAILMGDTITDLTGLTSEDIKNIVEESGGSIIDILSGDNETIKNIVASNTELIDLFDNVYATDLSNMTNNTATFEAELNRLLDKCKDDYQGYQDKVASVAQETGTTLGELARETDKVSDATDELYERGLDAAEALWVEVDAAADLSAQLSILAQQYLEVARAMAQVAQMQTNTVSSKVSFDADVDYSALMSSFLASGGNIESDTYKKLLEQRNAKIDWLETQGYDSNYWINRGDETTQNFKDLINGGGGQDWYKKAQAMYGEDWEEILKTLPGFATGGYTGEFTDGKLAFLHEKELVLNQEDTENILAATAAVRTLGPEFFASIERALDSSVSAGTSLMKERLNGTGDIQPIVEQLQQDVKIEAVFPNVTDHNEIEEALSNLTNDASQYIRRRTE